MSRLVYAIENFCLMTVLLVMTVVIYGYLKIFRREEALKELETLGEWHYM